MTVDVKVQDENGNNLAGIRIAGQVYFDTLFGQQQNDFSVVSNSDGAASFDPGNGIFGATIDWVADAPQTGDYVMQNGTWTISPFSGDVNEEIVMQKPGQGTTPHSSLWDSIVAFFKDLQGTAFWAFIAILVVVAIVAVVWVASESFTPFKGGNVGEQAGKGINEATKGVREELEKAIAKVQDVARPQSERESEKEKEAAYNKVVEERAAEVKAA